MLRTLIAALLAVSVSARTAADPANTERLLELTGMDRSIEAMAAQISQLVQAQVAQLPTRESDSERVTEYLTRIHTLISRELNWDAVKHDFVRAYDRTFTEEEVARLVDFFESPAGSKYVDQIPELQRQALEIAQQHAQLNLVPAIQQMVAQMQAELAANAHDVDSGGKADHGDN